jgi:nucleoid-associated protein YgaU
MSDAMYITAKMYNDQHFLNKSEMRIIRNRLRRQRIFRRQIMMLFAVITLVIVLVSFMKFSFHVDAQSEDFKPQIKYYTSVTVHSGDTLWSLSSEKYSAEHYKDLNSYISEVCKLNHISSADDLKAGESLIMPYYSSEYK